MKKLLPVLLLAAFILNSCEDDELRTITITHVSNISLSNGSRWVFITDINGNSIDYAKLPDDGSVVLRIPGSVKEGSVTLNYFTAGDNLLATISDLTSFAGVTPGSYTISKVRTFAAAEHAEVSLQNLPQDIDFNFSGQAFYMGRSGEVITLNVFPGNTTKAKALVSVINNETDEGRFHFFNIAGDEQLTLDFDSFSEFDNSEVTLSDGEVAFVTQNAYANDVEYHIRSKSFFFNNTSAQIPLYHSTSFDSYFTNIIVNEGAESYAHITNGPNLPSSFVRLNANAELASNDESGFTFNLSGGSDISRVQFTHEVDNRWEPNSVNTRTYYLPAQSVTSFRHPIVPAEIIQSTGLESYPNGTIRQISLIDYDDFETYDDFLRERFNGNKEFFLELTSSAKWRTKFF
jgi:hypothetical protein